MKHSIEVKGNDWQSGLHPVARQVFYPPAQDFIVFDFPWGHKLVAVPAAGFTVSAPHHGPTTASHPQP